MFSRLFRCSIYSCSVWAHRTPLRKCGNLWQKDNACSHSLMMCMSCVHQSEPASSVICWQRHSGSELASGCTRARRALGTSQVNGPQIWQISDPTSGIPLASRSSALLWGTTNSLRISSWNGWQRVAYGKAHHHPPNENGRPRFEVSREDSARCLLCLLCLRVTHAPSTFTTSHWPSGAPPLTPEYCGV